MWPCSGEAGLNCGAGGRLNVTTNFAIISFSAPVSSEEFFFSYICIVLKLQRIC